MVLWHIYTLYTILGRGNRFDENEISDRNGNGVEKYRRVFPEFNYLLETKINKVDRPSRIFQRVACGSFRTLSRAERFVLLLGALRSWIPRTASSSYCVPLWASDSATLSCHSCFVSYYKTELSSLIHIFRNCLNIQFFSHLHTSCHLI